MAIKNGDKISVDYEGRFEDGTVFDSSKHGDHSHPLEFTVGQQMVIPGFENGVIGMELNEEKELTISPKEAYGERNEMMVQKVPRSELPKEITPEKGMVLGLHAPDGRQIPVPIVDVSDTEITLDLNHPLAGKTLIFKVKVIKIN